MKHKFAFVTALLVFACFVTNAQEQPKKPAPSKKFEVIEIATNDAPIYHKYVRTLPQYKLWLSEKRKLELMDQKYTFLHLPDSAMVIDEKTFQTSKGKRTIVAWMTDALIHLHTYEYSVYEGCPAVTSGNGYFTGRLHFTLVNTQTRQKMNTLDIKPSGYTDTLCLGYPFCIANPKNSDADRLVYSATGGTKNTDGFADIIHLFDFNRDGKAYEFALFEAEDCATMLSTLISYNEAQDRLIWHEWDLTVKYQDKDYKDVTEQQKTYWMDHTMRTTFGKDGTLNYYISYMGRGGDLDKYYLKFDKNTDTYSGILDKRILPEDTSAAGPNLPTMMELVKRNKRK